MQILLVRFTTLRPRQNGCHFPDDIFKWIILNENVWILLKISLKFVPKVQINNIVALVQMMAWHRPGDKSLFEIMMVSLLPLVCLLLLILMLWHRQAIFESKGDNLSSSAECRTRSWEVWDTKLPADWMPTHKPTELSTIKASLGLGFFLCVLFGLYQQFLCDTFTQIVQGPFDRIWAVMRGRLSPRQWSNPVRYQSKIPNYNKNTSLIYNKAWAVGVCPGIYRQTSNISHTLVDNKIVDHSDVVGASPVGAAPTTSSFSA